MQIFFFAKFCLFALAYYRIFQLVIMGLAVRFVPTAWCSVSLLVDEQTICMCDRCLFYVQYVVVILLSVFPTSQSTVMLTRLYSLRLPIHAVIFAQRADFLIQDVEQKNRSNRIKQLVYAF